MMLLAAHGAAVIGGLLAKKYKLPAGAMIGAMAAVAAFGLIVGRAAAYPADLRVVVQICSGAIIGSRFTRRDVGELRQILLPTLILLIGLLGFNMVFALLISALSPLDAATALFASAPGGMSDLAIIAPDFGADPQQVTLLQMFRFVFVLSVFPPLMKRLLRQKLSEAARAEAAPDAPQPKDPLPHEAPLSPGQMAGRTVLSLGAAAAGGFLFRWLQIPAGAVVGAVFATVLVNVFGRQLVLPVWLRLIIQISCGCFVGCQITREAISSIGSLIVPMVLVIVEVMVMAFVTSWVIHRRTGLDKTTALFSSIPGGVTEMSLLAEDLGLDTPKITAAHTCRVIAVICLMPILVRLFS